MNIFEELNGVLGGLGIPVETGVFSGTAPDAYLVIVVGAEFTITDRRYIGYETETGYHHYVVDAQKNYELED